METKQGSNSVLFALGELRDIEDDRLRTQREREAALEAERRRLQKEREEMERRREEQRRFELELAERRASIEAQMKLEERRIALELERVPTPTLDAPARPRWPWLMSVAVLALAGMQFLMWQMQRNLDASLHELQIAQQENGQPVILDEAPVPPPPAEPAPAPSAAAPAEPDPKPIRKHKPPRTPPKKPEGIPCGDTEDPLGCLPTQR